MTDIITDTWGNVPYSDVAKLEKEGLLYCKYDDQKDIYVSSLRLGACGIHNLDVLFYVLLAFAFAFFTCTCCKKCQHGDGGDKVLHYIYKIIMFILNSAV